MAASKRLQESPAALRDRVHERTIALQQTSALLDLRGHLAAGRRVNNRVDDNRDKTSKRRRGGGPGIRLAWTPHAATDVRMPRPSDATKVDSANIAPTHGRHLLLDFSDCGCDPELLERADVLEAFCIRASRAAGMDVVGHAFHQFKPTGVTGVVLLAESHLSVHTWPEQRFVAADVYVCDHLSANASKGRALADALRQAFAAGEVVERDIVRRSLDLTPAD